MTFSSKLAPRLILERPVSYSTMTCRVTKTVWLEASPLGELRIDQVYIAETARLLRHQHLLRDNALPKRTSSLSI